ncbi:MAG TPA: family 20 glycosylhydrolase [Fimbriimonadaceae bacterium]|nr:family 20 glycosylhydrolase [Fimbriimonadaceae bacterium]
MQLRIWTYDLAREQCASLEHLRISCDATLAGGYNAIGLYLEHRFAYPSAPWAHGRDCLEPEVVQRLQEEYPQLQIIPFVNLLGHFEGMIYTEQGKRFREGRFQGMQACPSNPEFVEFARHLIDDVLSAFGSEIVHIGGDETWQLGKCPRCAERVERDGKAALYGEHFGPLARYVVEMGRRPAVWGDMYLDHPAALDYMPEATLIFDWQYFGSPLETSGKFQDRGFEVVCCPSLQTYNAAWFHLEQSEENVRQAASAAGELDAHGVCVTTWECALLGNYETLIPAIKASGRMLAKTSAEGTFLAAYGEESERHGEWARLMAVELQKLGGVFGHSQIRSSLKARLLLQANPFLAWLHHHEELTGEAGDQALAILEKAIHVAPNGAYRGVSEFVKGAVEFVRYADQARQAYANGLPGVAAASLAPCRQIFENLEKIARATYFNIGGSLADIERCRVAREHVERVVKRIKEYGDGSLGYLPAFEHLTHHRFVPHDQGAWWLINRWASE